MSLEFRRRCCCCRSVTCLEDLANEILFEIFDYLDGCDILHAFSHLNNHFEQFLHHSSYLYRIYRFSTREHTFQSYCRRYLLSHRYQILSLHLFDQVLINSFFQLSSPDLSFSRLQSLVLIAIKPSQLLVFLHQSTNYPRLIRLTIRLIGPTNNLDHLYGRIFQISTLKSLKFSIAMEEKQFILPTNFHSPISSLERFNLDHDCSIRQLDHLLSYTPHLQHLICRRLLDARSVLPNRLENLRSISIKDWDVSFDHFEIFVKQLHCSKLEALSFVNRSNDLTYLDADLWQKLIDQSIPRLHRLNFQFVKRFPSEDFFPMIQRQIRQFWIEHRWIFQLEINFREMIYSFHPYR